MKPEIDPIISQYKEKIYRTCLGFCGDQDQAKDIFQEVCIRIWSGLDQFRGDAQLSTWIYRVTVNTCLLFLRSNRRESQISLEEVTDLPAEAEPEISLELRLQLLRRFIQELPGKDRLLIVLYLEELPYAQISEVTGLSPNHIGVKISRIKKLLTRKFAAHGPATIDLEQTRQHSN